MNQKKYGVILSYINIFVKNGVNFIYVPFLLKYVGQADYGLFQMTYSTIMGLSLLSLGFSSAYVKFYMSYKFDSDSEKNVDKLNGFYLILFICISLLSLIIGGILTLNTGYIFGNSLNFRELQITQKLMFILVINISLSFISSVFESFILANEKFIFQQFRQVMQSVLVPLIAIPFIILGFGVLSIVTVQTFITLVFLVLNIHYCLKKLNMKFEFKNIPKKYMQEIGVFSFFIFLNQIVDMVNNNAPNFILGILAGPKQVATFSIALQIKNIFFMLSVSLSNVYIPMVNKLISKKTEKSELTDLMIILGRYQMLILFYILGGFIVVGRYFISAWAGSENEIAYFLVIIMVLPSLIPLSQNIGIEIQKGYNKHMFRSIVYIIFAVVNIAITIIGTKYFGLIGTCLGYVISMVFANGILMNWYYHNKLGLNMIKYWFKTLNTLLPFIIVVPTIFFLERYILVNSFFRFIVIAGIYTVIYFFLYYLIVANDEEKNKIKFKY